MILLYFGDKYSAHPTCASYAVLFTGVVFFLNIKEATKSRTTNTDENDWLNKERDVPDIFWIYLISVNRIKREEREKRI